MRKLLMISVACIAIAAGVGVLMPLRYEKKLSPEVYIEPSQRPTCVVKGGVATVVFPFLSAPRTIHAWGGVKHIAILPWLHPLEGYFARLGRGGYFLFNYRNKDGQWALVPDHPGEEWSSGIVIEHLPGGVPALSCKER
jgi:hypothetical protein